jgi:hypothetical protein
MVSYTEFTGVGEIALAARLVGVAPIDLMKGWA